MCGGGTGFDKLASVAVDAENSVVAAGYTNSATSTFGGVVLTGSLDAPLWKLSAEVGRCMLNR